MALDDGVRTVFGRPPMTDRAAPDAGIAEVGMTESQRRVSEGLMRVNHTGEVCAQALYSAQALTARDAAVRERMQRAAEEENAHLIWCERRVQELGGHLSYLNPLWYLGSFAIGALAGLAGDKWNLGFVVETERQVEGHLDDHLQRLPAEDAKSRAIVAQMQQDEIRHAAMALQEGAAELPAPIKRLMALHSKVMTAIAYRV
jgi:ubiquinone biosynthesis monooxygenase Coq7